MTNFAKGDVVTIRGVVEYIHDGDLISVKIGGYYQNIHIGPESLTFVHGSFDIGERIWVDDLYGFVRAINGEMAWIEREDRTDYVTIPLRDLTRAPVALAEAAE